ncbi:MAG: hypothetical protein ACTS8S_11750 [Giesbergeria sp.]
MSLSSSLTIAQLNPDGSVPIPVASDAAANAAAAAAALQREARCEALQAQADALQELLNKPLNEILADREKALEAAAAWDAFGAMWVLSQRAMRRVAMDLAAQHGVDEADVIARAMAHANAVLNGDGEDLDGSIAPAQMAHIARHRPYLRKQFRQG